MNEGTKGMAKVWYAFKWKGRAKRASSRMSIPIWETQDTLTDEFFYGSPLNNRLTAWSEESVSQCSCEARKLPGKEEIIHPFFRFLRLLQAIFRWTHQIGFSRFLVVANCGKMVNYKDGWQFCQLVVCIPTIQILQPRSGQNTTSPTASAYAALNHHSS